MGKVLFVGAAAQPWDMPAVAVPPLWTSRAQGLPSRCLLVRLRMGLTPFSVPHMLVSKPSPKKSLHFSRKTTAMLIPQVSQRRQHIEDLRKLLGPGWETKGSPEPYSEPVSCRKRGRTKPVLPSGPLARPLPSKAAKPQAKQRRQCDDAQPTGNRHSRTSGV